MRHAACCAALVINDIQSDVIGSFTYGGAQNRPCMIRILLEETDDNLDFANEVKAQLVAAYPQLATKMER